MDVNHFDYVGTAWPKARFENGFLIASGKGRPWLGSVATPWWRDLAGLVVGGIVDLQNADIAEMALASIRRSGLPGGYSLAHGPLPFALDGSTPASEAFIRLAVYCNAMASFWQPPDEDGVSYFHRIVQPPGMSPLAELFVNAVRIEPVEPIPVGSLILGFKGNIGNPTVWIKCDSLDDYLRASAAIHIATHQTLAKCWQCGSWYAPRRPTRAHYCSSTCRSAASKAAKAKAADEIAPTLSKQNVA